MLTMHFLRAEIFLEKAGDGCWMVPAFKDYR